MLMMTKSQQSLYSDKLPPDNNLNAVMKDEERQNPKQMLMDSQNNLKFFRNNIAPATRVSSKEFTFKNMNYL